jgi:hypothetical protein
MKNKKVIGVTRVSVGWKIGLLKDVADKLKVDIGDKLIYFEEGDRVYIEKA